MAAGSSIGRLALASVGVALVVTALKYLAYLKTGSVALYSDALESIINVLTAVVAFVAVRFSDRPADRQHQFGHHKAEYFSAVLEAALIILAALLILVEAYQALIDPRPLRQPFEGLLISGVATGLNAAWSWFLIGRGRSLRLARTHRRRVAPLQRRGYVAGCHRRPHTCDVDWLHHSRPVDRRCRCAPHRLDRLAPDAGLRQRPARRGCQADVAAESDA